MPPFQKFRRFEFGLILIAFTIYITRRLFQLAHRFDADVELAEHALKSTYPTPRAVSTIWDNLAPYNHEMNTILPVIAGGILFFLGWAVFHFIAFPLWQSKTNQQTLLATYLIITVVLCLGSVFFYDYFKLYWRFRLDRSEQIIGFKVYSLFRKTHLLTNTIALLTFIGLYELAVQFYYYIKTKLQEEAEKNYEYLDYLLITFVSIFILVFALTGQLPVSFWNGGLKDLVYAALLSGTVYIGQGMFSTRVMPFISDFRSKEFLTGALLFLVSMGIGSMAFFGFRGIFRSNHGSFSIGPNIEELFLTFILLTLASAIVALLKHAFFREKRQLTTLFTQKTAELSSLRSQINPHFLFNALNTLYSVSLKENAEKTADGIQKLGDMMRFMLNENNQERIPLDKEIEYLQNYIEIQQMRIAESDNIEIKVNIQRANNEIFVAPMLLNPFIENAFKHGISFRKPSWIYITLTSDDTKLYFKVHNSLHEKSESDPEKNSNGIGLENVRKRLELIYKNRYALDIQQSSQDFFVSLTITYW